MRHIPSEIKLQHAFCFDDKLDYYCNTRGLIVDHIEPVRNYTAGF